MKKKGQGLSLNTIIVAAIVLIVLIVLWAIFTGRMGGFASGMVSTEKCSDVCDATGGSVDGTCVATDNNYVGKYDADGDGKLEDTDLCCCNNPTTT